MRIFILISLLFASFNLYADSFKSEEATQEFANKIISKMAEEKFQEALDMAKPYWPLAAVEIDGIANAINNQWPIVSKRFGKPIGTEFIKKERIGKSFIRYYYLHKFQNHAIYWSIDYYKPQQEWKINQIAFRDLLGGLYE